ncbi:MAG: acyltransferase [Planctomycetota bacterium]
MREQVKAVVNAVFVLLLFPAALISGFGRWGLAFDFFAHACALVPGILGEYVRRGYYVMTLRRCSPRSCISFGSYFSHSDAEVADGVYVGAYCVIGRARLGARTQIGCNVHVLSGRRQHPRDDDGRLLGSEHGVFETVRIGEDCWIGTSAIVMADVGARVTISAGAVVTREIPGGVVAVGNPARPLEPSDT